MATRHFPGTRKQRSGWHGKRGFVWLKVLLERSVEWAEVRMANVRVEFESTKVAESGSYNKRAARELLLNIHLIHFTYLANPILEFSVSRNKSTQWT